MSDDLSIIIEEASATMAKAINHLEAELVKIRAGKANPVMLDGIVADYYGSPTPISQIANITTLDARTISVTPWEKNMLSVIERDRKSTRLNSSHSTLSRMPSSA